MKIKKRKKKDKIRHMLVRRAHDMDACAKKRPLEKTQKCAAVKRARTMATEPHKLTAVDGQQVSMPPIEGMCDELMLLILSKLPCTGVARGAAAVNRRWRAIATDASCVVRACRLHGDGPSDPLMLCAEAMRTGHEACFRSVCETQDLRRSICTMAAAAGRLDCLRYAHALGYRLTYNTCEAALGRGHLDCLRYLHENGCEWGLWPRTMAAAGGRLDCLAYAHEHARALGDHWRRADLWSTITETPRNSYLACLIRLLARAHAIDFYWRRMDIVGAAKAAAENGHLACLAYARAHGCRMNTWGGVAEKAAKNGHLHCLKYVHENGWRMDIIVILAAAKGGHLDCLQYAHKNGGRVIPAATQAAAERGHLDCLWYARENERPYDAIGPAGRTDHAERVWWFLMSASVLWLVLACVW